MDAIHSLIDRLLHAANTHDLAGLLACCHPTVALDDPATSAPTQGHVAIQAQWNQALAVLPDLLVHDEGRLAHDDRAVLQWVATGTPRVASGHQPQPIVTIRGAAFLALEDGLVRRLSLIWDTQPIGSRLPGAEPAHASDA